VERLAVGNRSNVVCIADRWENGAEFMGATVPITMRETSNGYAVMWLNGTGGVGMLADITSETVGSRTQYRRWVVLGAAKIEASLRNASNRLHRVSTFDPRSKSPRKTMPKQKRETAKEMKIARKKILRLADSLSGVEPEYRMSAYIRAVREEASVVPRRGNPLLPGSFEGGKKRS
jgi:hypothetical protein